MDDCEVQRMACVWVDAMAGEMVSNEAARSAEKMVRTEAAKLASGSASILVADWVAESAG